MSLMMREDLRLAVSIGLAAGLGSISSIPDGYYLPLTIAAVMAGSYGSSYALGLQRVICTLLGAIVLLICQPALVQLPFPVGLALVLGLIRWIGGMLGLQAGYKIAGLVVIMGWTMQSTAAIDTWLGLKVSWTALGVLLALLSLNLFWPSTAIRDHHRAFQRLLTMQCEALLQQVSAGRLSPGLRKQRHRELMRALLDLQQSRAAAVAELGTNPYRQPLMHLWQDLERCCAALAGCITALRALREPETCLSPMLEQLHAAESALFEACAELLGVWIAALRVDPLRSPDQHGTFKLAACIDQLRLCEQAVFQMDQVLPIATPLQFQMVSRRLLLCHQVGAILQRMDARWLEMISGRHHVSVHQ